MLEYSKDYPNYKWDKNKGYGTKDHFSAIKQFGPTPLHRKSFLKNLITQ
jgi:ribonuclease HII